MTIWTTVKNAMRLIGKRRRLQFLGLALFAFFVSLSEAVSAGFVLGLVQFAVSPETLPKWPIIGDFKRFAPGLSDTSLILIYAGVFAVFFAIRSAAFLYQEYLIARTTEKTGAELATKLLTVYLHVPYSFHLTRNSAESIRNVHQTVQELVANVFRPTADVIAEAIFMVTLLILLATQSLPATGAAIMVLGFLVILVLRVIQPRLKLYGRQRQTAARRSLLLLQQALGAVRELKFVASTRSTLEKFSEARGEMGLLNSRRVTASVVPRTVIELGLVLFILGWLGFGVVTAGTRETDSTLALLGFFAYVGFRLQPSAQRFVKALNDIRFSTAHVEDISADLFVLGRQVEGATDSAPARLKLESEIRLDNVGHQYAESDRWAVSDIDLTIRRGEFVGICGRTGSGKTTLVDVLTGLLIPTHGMLNIDGRAIGEDLLRWRQSIGIVPQTIYLLDDSIRNNIALGIPTDEIDDDLVGEVVSAAQLDNLIERLPMGVDTLIGERGARLSGGERQRICIARALYRRPDVLVLDEATSALDSSTESMIVDSINEARGRITTIVIAHRLSTVMTCDRIVVMERGRIVAIGPYRELMESEPHFRALAVGNA